MLKFLWNKIAGHWRIPEKHQASQPDRAKSIDRGGEVIGRYRSETDWFPTTRGVIHYGKDGLHIIPARPAGADVLNLNSNEAPRVCWYVKRALGGQTPASLRASSFAVDARNKEITLRAHFGEPPSEDELEDISVVESEIMADFADPYEISTETEIVPVGQPI